MAELVAVQSGLALFKAGEVGIVIDTQDLNPYDPQPLATILAAGEWSTNVEEEDVPAVCSELAEVALEGVETDVSLTASMNDQRLVRVPRKVQEAVRTGSERTAGRDDITPMVTGLSQLLASETVTVGVVKRAHAWFDVPGSDDVHTALGGDATREWAARVCGVTAAVAPDLPDDDAFREADAIDPTQPHEFVVLDSRDEPCAICELPEADAIHVLVDEGDVTASRDAEAADDDEAVTYFAGFAPGGDVGPTFKVNTLLAQDSSGGWWLREFGEWVPTQAPDADADIVQLDPESFQATITQLDEPGTEYAELSISEERLFAHAEAHLDLDRLDAVFAAAPYIPPEVRSANAKKQMRDAKGHFVHAGGTVVDAQGNRGHVVGIHQDNGMVDVKTGDGQVHTIPASSVTVDRNAGAANTGTGASPGAPQGNVVAHLDQPAALVQDVPALLARYRQKWNEEQSVTAAGPPDDSVLVPPGDASTAPPAPPADDATDPVATAGVTPLYLAEVDPKDTGAVLNIFAVIPAQAQGDAIEVYKRDAGKWVSDPDDQQALTGPTPPAITELDAGELTNVLSQMDPAAPSDAVAAAARSLAVKGYALNQRFELEPTGLTAAQTVGARLLSPYGDATAYPWDIQDRLNEFLLGKEATPKDVKSTERLRQYWVHGEGAAKIRWGEPNDWYRCVDHLSKYMGDRAKGYCTLRHHDALGRWPGQEGERRGGGHVVASLVGEVQESDATDAAGVDPDLPHPYMDDESAELADGGNCALCDRGMDHPIHVMVLPLEVVNEEPEDDPERVPHNFLPGPAGLCECGQPVNDPLHTFTDSPDESALPQLEGGYSQGQDFTSNDAELADPAGMTAGQQFRIPLIVPEGKESGDGRQFAQGALTTRPMPLALMWQPEGDEGHKGSVIVGRVDHVERTGNGLGNGYGVFDTGPYGREALRLVRAGMLRGISADLDEFEAQVLSEGESDETVTAQKLLVNKGRLMGVTLVAKPAYAECTIELVDGDGETDVADGEYTQDTGEARVAALIASAAPLQPPAEWFTNPQLDKPTHLSVTDDGRVYGHIAAWDVDHIGLPFGTRAPRSASNYAYFRTGVIRTAEDNEVPVGQLTLTGGHAPLKASASEAVKHYDDTASAVADLAAGEDQYGIWVAGALRPGVTPEQVRALRASSPSGDWRPIKGKLELVAVCQVNVPGFPVARAMVASGVVTALVAAGALALEERPVLSQSDIDRRIAALETAEQRRLDAAALVLRERIAPVLTERRAALTAAATAVYERVNAARQERQQALLAAAETAKDRVHPERVELRAKADELRARIAAAGLHVAPDFEETKHPRGEHGRFREVLGRLELILKGESGSDENHALERVQDAAGKEDAGDHSGAARAGAEAAEKLDNAAAKASGEAKARLVAAADDVRTAVNDANAEKDGKKTPEDRTPGEVLFDELTEPVKEDLRMAIDHAESKLNPGDVDPKIQKLKKFLEGVNPMDLRQVHAFIKNNLKQAYTPATPKVSSEVTPGAAPPQPQPVVH